MMIRRILLHQLLLLLLSLQHPGCGRLGKAGQGHHFGLLGRQDLKVRDGMRSQTGPVEGNSVSVVRGIVCVHGAGKQAVLRFAEPWNIL